MNKLILMIGIVMLIGGCIPEQKNNFIDEQGNLIPSPPLNPPTESELCKILSEFESTEWIDFPNNITVDNKTIDFINLNLTKKDYFNLSEKIEEEFDNLIDFRIFDYNGLLIYKDTEQYYIRCNIQTINRLIELNASDILYDICIRYPDIERVEIRGGYWRDENHIVIVCWD